VGRQALSRLRAGDPLRVGDLTIVPLEHLRATVRCEGLRVSAAAHKRAAGIVVLGAGGTRALDEAGRPLDLEELVTRVAGLREILG
jgi:hypothetical protein